MNLGQEFRNALREYLNNYKTIEEALADLDAEDARAAEWEEYGYRAVIGKEAS